MIFKIKMQIIERLISLKEEKGLKIRLAIDSICCNFLYRVNYHLSSSRLQDKIEQEGGLDSLLRGISLNPNDSFVPADLVEKRFTAAIIGALAYHAARFGRHIRKDVSRQEQIYRRCEFALGSRIINQDLVADQGY